MENPNNPWKKLSQEIKYENNWIRVDEHKVINPSGGEGIYGTVHFKNRAIGIIPLDENDSTWLVGQYRYPLGRFSWEIPEGGCPIKEDNLTSAKRELKEETGLLADRWTEILKMDLSNSVSDEKAIIYLAESLRQDTVQREATEVDMKVKKVSFQEAIEMVSKGQITDSMSVAGILKLARIKGW